MRRDILPSGRQASRILTSTADTRDGAEAPSVGIAIIDHHWRAGVLGFVQPPVGLFPRDPIDSVEPLSKGDEKG